MENIYELIKNEEGLACNALIHSVDHVEMHCHQEIELLFVLSGAIHIQVGGVAMDMQEGDLILINGNQVHSTSKTEGENILLYLQIGRDYSMKSTDDLHNIYIECNSMQDKKQEQYDPIRKSLARIVWTLNKKQRDYKFLVNSEVSALLDYLLNHFPNQQRSDVSLQSSSKNMARLQSVISFINGNIDKKVTLQDVADHENLNVYYLSHFIKKMMGISFQEYINILRVDKAIQLLTMSDDSITSIAFNSGFSSAKSFNVMFKQINKCTPSNYRKRYRKRSVTTNPVAHKSKSYYDVDRTKAFALLFTYLDSEEECKTKIKPLEEKTVTASVAKEGRQYRPYWNKLMTFTRAAEGLRANWRQQLSDLQSELGFEYIRFHGIFSDDMMIIHVGEQGEIEYNWSYIDELFDFLMDQNLKPFVEFGFMPTELSSKEHLMFHWKANVSQPRDMGQWTDLILHFVRHCILRYGKAEVESWYFEVWNEPDLEQVFWYGSKEDYFNFYLQTVAAVKSVNQNLRVGGPSIIYHNQGEPIWLQEFLAFCKKKNAMLDFVSVHIYPELVESFDTIKDVYLNGTMDMQELLVYYNSLKRVYADRDHTLETLKSLRKLLKQTQTEVHVTEWNASAYSRNLIHDTCFTPAFIVHNVIQCIGMADSLGYWSFTDINEEAKAGMSTFHGGFGLMTQNGIKKASYYAYYLLNRLGNQIIKKDEDYIITKNKDNLQVMAYNYAYFDNLFMNGDTSALTMHDRYRVFESKETKRMTFELHHLRGNYKITTYQLNRKSGSAYDEWVKMGAPKDMNREELAYLKRVSQPKMKVETVKIDGDYSLVMDIPVHGIELVLFDKLGT